VGGNQGEGGKDQQRFRRHLQKKKKKGTLYAILLTFLIEGGRGKNGGKLALSRVALKAEERGRTLPTRPRRATYHIYPT